MRKSVVEYVAYYAEKTPSKTAVIVNGVRTSYSELFDLVCGYSEFLKKSGVKKGDIIVTKAAQKLDYVVTYLSVHLSGAVIASVERNMLADNMLEIAKKLNGKYIISSEKFDCGADVEIIECSDVVETAKAYFTEKGNVEFPLEDDSADILFTTGTTGASKGVELSHKALTATAENLIYGCGYKEDTLMIVPGPLNHANAIRKIFTTLVNGSTVCILNGMMNLKKFYDALDYQDANVSCCLPPAAIRTIFQITQDKISEYAHKIDFIESATAPLPEADKKRLCNLLPDTRLYNNYGSSESASVCMYDYNKYPGLQNCVGKAMPNSEIVIVDDNGTEIESSKDKLGLVACKGDVNMKGYVNDPDETSRVLRDGIVYTNDIGYIDDNGFIFIIGRKGDVINVGGLKVAPTEVESAMLENDIIDDCICIGVDDAIVGKALRLLVVINEKADFDPKELRRFLSTKLESHKVPAQYEQVDHIERTYNGKLNRKHYVDYK